MRAKPPSSTATVLQRVAASEGDARTVKSSVARRPNVECSEYKNATIARQRHRSSPSASMLLLVCFIGERILSREEFENLTSRPRTDYGRDIVSIRCQSGGRLDLPGTDPNLKSIRGASEGRGWPDCAVVLVAHSIRTFDLPKDQLHRLQNIIIFKIRVKLSSVSSERNGATKTPFDVSNKWLFGIKTVVICSIGFWAPFIVIDYQLRKANQ
ncbi:unnamed protein product [Heligmosomoides polygyrus]|uniref:Cytochrome c oxidase polypeptide VIIc n=1 Tax=Heligmosomoides polygyrus TaxID=6339 RepID=A0A183G1A6_HELPZ|nr:unnamed protein product [Heligmosomoides polygyrus]